MEDRPTPRLAVVTDDGLTPINPAQVALERATARVQEAHQALDAALRDLEVA
jgi:hypothetical protein